MKNSPPAIWKYMALGGQFFVSISLALAVGWKLDQWLDVKQSLLIWILPLAMVVFMLIKIIIETNKK
jgi:chromate transport protein ChrA